MYGMHHWPVWGARPRRRAAAQGPRRVPLHQRRDAAAGQPRLHPDRDRRAGRAARRARPPLGAARLLRHGQPQRQGDLRQVPGLVRRQPGQPPPAAARGGGASATSSSWAAPTRCCAKARAAYDRGEYRWVAEVVNHVVFADPANTRGARAAGRRARAARLPVRVRHLAQPLPHRRPGAAPRRRPTIAGVQHRQPGQRARDEPGPVLQLPRRAAQRASGPATSGSSLNLDFTDTGEQVVRASSPTARSATCWAATDDDADATITLTRTALDRFILGDHHPRRRSRIGRDLGRARNRAAGRAALAARHLRGLVQHRRALSR